MLIVSYIRVQNNGQVQPEWWIVQPKTSLAGHADVHSWIENQILDCKSYICNLFFYYDLSYENIHQWVSVQMTKTHSLTVCPALKIDRNAIQTAGVIIS